MLHCTFFQPERFYWRRLINSTLLMEMWLLSLKICSEKWLWKPQYVKVGIKIYFYPPFHEQLLPKQMHSSLRVSSLIIPAPPCWLLPALLLSVWVCLWMRHSLLNSERYRYSEWTFKGMTQTCTFGCTVLNKHRRWRGVQQTTKSYGHVENRDAAAEIDQ